MKQTKWKSLSLCLFLLLGVASMSIAQGNYAKKKSNSTAQVSYKKSNNRYGNNKKKNSEYKYKYNKGLSIKVNTLITKNRYVAKDIRALRNYGMDGKKYVETYSVVMAVEKNQLGLMAKAGMTELYKGKFLTEKEHAILMNLLHKDGYNKYHYAEYQKYRRYSTRIAQHIFTNLKDYCPRVTSSKRYMVKRDKSYRAHLIKIIMGTFTATDDLARIKKMRKGYDAYTSGYALAGKILKYVKINYNDRYKSEYGFKPSPDGQGDGDYRKPQKFPMPHGGWPWRISK